MLQILYVDDDPALLEICKIFLEAQGMMLVDTAISAGVALQKIKEKPYDAIVSDYEMPSMNGIQFLKLLRSSGDSLPFIVFTGKGREEIVIEAFNSGADSYVQKGGSPKAQFAELGHKILKGVDRRNAEQALERSNSVLQATLDATSDGILVIGPDRKITAFNQKFIRMWNLPVDLAEGDNCERVFDHIVNETGDPAGFRMKIESILGQPDANNRDIITLTDGRIFSLLTRPQMMDHAVIGRVFSFRDNPVQNREDPELRAAYEEIKVAEEQLSDRKVAERVLAESLEKYRNVFRAENNPMLLIDLETLVIQDVNDAACQAYGYFQKEFLGKCVLDLCAEPDQPLHDIRKKKPGVKAYHHVRKDGSIFPVEVSTAFFILNEREVFLHSVRDITSARLMEDALKLANIKLNLLLGITRHDVMNKLLVLMGSNELLCQKVKDPELSKMLELQQRAIQSIQGQIEFTREYENLGAGGLKWLRINDIILHVNRQFSGTVTLCCKLGELEIHADPMIEKVFYNLFDNAFRYGECITGIKISSAEKGDRLTIVFEDDGVGISPEEKEKIFGQGYGKNTGLGLFLTKEILSVTGMSIRESGEYRKGARFEIEIPSGQYRYPQRDHRDHGRSLLPVQAG